MFGKGGASFGPFGAASGIQQPEESDEPEEQEEEDVFEKIKNPTCNW